MTHSGGCFRTPSVPVRRSLGEGGSEGPSRKPAVPRGGRSLTVAVLKRPLCLPAECVTDPGSSISELVEPFWCGLAFCCKEGPRTGIGVEPKHGDRRCGLGRLPSVRGLASSLSLRAEGWIEDILG